MTDPDATHYAAPATQRTACGLRRDGRRTVTADSARVNCPECQEELARLAERRLRGPPPIGDPSYVSVPTLRDVARTAGAVAPWAVGVRAEDNVKTHTVTVVLAVAEDPEYYRDHAHLVAERLRLALPAGVELRVEIELAESCDG